VLNSGSGGQGVTVKNGYFSVNLGSITTLVGVDLTNRPMAVHERGRYPNQPAAVPHLLTKLFAGRGDAADEAAVERGVCRECGSANTCTSCILQARQARPEYDYAIANSVVGLTVKRTSARLHKRWW